jgi:nitrite reductase/ring-hydroxylating ferredoxin subunit
VLKENSNFVKVAALSDVADGKPRAVRVEGHSIALFQHEGAIYATDNQCPHMGYPLVRGRVRQGVLSCDWHGWSYDMEGGGCFTGGCDDLATFPVEVRNGDVYIDVASGGKKRADAHFLLLKEGLLSTDSWTLSKAIAIMLAKGVSEEETLELMVKHMGRHISTDRDAFEGGRKLAMMMNGVKVARMYQPEDRLIPFMMAADGASGRLGDRPDRQPLPPPVDWQKLEDWIRVFSTDKEWEGIEKCLITARQLGGHDEKIIPLFFERAVEPFFLNHSRNLIDLTHLAELLEQFGWELTGELVCSLGAKILGQGRGRPGELHREAIQKLEEISPIFDELPQETSIGSSVDYDENKFSAALVSGDLDEVFDAVTEMLTAGIPINTLATTMVMTAGDRMARTPVNMSPGWWDLQEEMEISSTVRKVLRHGGTKIAAKALYHAAWRFFNNRWLNIRHQSITESRTPTKPIVLDEDTALSEIVDAIESVRIQEIGRRTREYLNAGCSAERLMTEMGLCILKDDNGDDLLSSIRIVSEEWKTCESHPARNQLIVGLARWATDIRRNAGNDSAVQTAYRFARGETATELYE